MNTAYLAPKDLNTTARKLMEQLATWDRLEETWEVVLPLPHAVSVEMNPHDEWETTHKQVEEALSQNGLACTTFRFIKGILTISEIRLD